MNKGEVGFYVALIISQIWLAAGESGYGIAWSIVSILVLIIGKYK
jgi:hypothetical protein